MKKNLRKLATMGAIALSLSTGITPVMGAVITVHAETDAERHRKWARDYEDANWNGVYNTHNIAAKVTATEWEDDIRDIEKGRTMGFTEYSVSVEYTRSNDGKIQILKVDDENWNEMRDRLGWTYEEFINDAIGHIEKYDNQFSHTYIPVTKKMVLGKGFLLTAHYDMIQTNNDPIQKYREYDQTGGIDEELSKSLESNTSSSSNNHSSSGGSSSSNKAKSTNSSSLTGWVSTSDGWMYQIDGVYATGWVNVGGTWYFMNHSGIMQTGWVSSNGKWYYMNSNGSMATGWINLGGKWYYLNASGDMATSWVNSNGKWYYLDNDGHMLANTTVGNYRLDASGAWVQ